MEVTMLIGSHSFPSHRRNIRTPDHVPTSYNFKEGGHKLLFRAGGADDLNKNVIVSRKGARGVQM